LQLEKNKLEAHQMLEGVKIGMQASEKTKDKKPTEE
jgi:hypothetical protein